MSLFDSLSDCQEEEKVAAANEEKQLEEKVVDVPSTPK